MNNRKGSSKLADEGVERLKVWGELKVVLENKKLDRVPVGDTLDGADFTALDVYLDARNAGEVVQQLLHRSGGYLHRISKLITAVYKVTAYRKTAGKSQRREP